MIDHLVMKFRMVKFARIPSYNQLFSGDPVWATLEVAGIGMDGRSMVTKSDYRFLHTLENMGPSSGAEPDRSVFLSPAGELQEICSSYLCADQLHPVRERRRDAVRYGATTTPSAAAYPQLRPVKRCSSSAHVQTWQSACCTQSTAVVDDEDQRAGWTGVSADHFRVSGLR